MNLYKVRENDDGVVYCLLSGFSMAVRVLSIAAVSGLESIFRSVAMSADGSPEEVSAMAGAEAGASGIWPLPA